MTNTEQPRSPNDFHARIRVLEEWRLETRQMLTTIATKIDALATLVTQGRAQSHCPEPGACLPLRREVAELKKEHADLRAWIMRLERWQVFLSGVAAAIGVVWTIIRFIWPLLSDGRGAP